MPDKIPVILDTDIGSDIDDAVALAYLLKHPRCELVGVTVVTGDVARRAACAQVICRAAGRDDIPIHCGASSVMLMGPGQPACPQYDAISGRPHRTDWPRNTAVDFLRQTIRRRPGEITLLTIGPYTNAGILFALDPEIPSLLKQMVSMGGVFFEGPDRREWNALVDPVATAIVYRNAPPRHASIGLDVTMKCQMPAEEVRRLFRPSPLDVVAEMAEVFFRKARMLTFHDPLAGATIFRQDLCTWKTGRINVTIEADENRCGRTVFTEAADGPHAVACEVNPAAFFAEYFSVFGA